MTTLNRQLILAKNIQKEREYKGQVRKEKGKIDIMVKHFKGEPQIVTVNKSSTTKNQLNSQTKT